MKAETIDTMPLDWRERSLDELCFLRKELVEPSSAGNNRYVGLEHVDPGIAQIRRWGNDKDLRSTKSRFYAGDVLYGKLRPYLDKAALAEWEGVCSTDILTLNPRTEVADPRYLSFLLHASAFINHAVATTSGVNHPRTSWASIASFLHPIPPLLEQKAIAAVLSKIQTAAEVQEKIVTALRELKAATMAKLFREGLRGERLKQTEIGEMPESWEVRQMRGITEVITKGSSPNWQGFEYCENGVLFIRSQNIGLGELLLSEVVRLPEEFNLKERRSILSPGDLLINIVGASIGRAAVADKRLNRANINQAVALVRFRSGYNPFFFMHFLITRGGLDQMHRQKKEIARANLSLEDVGSFLVPVPAREEQDQIADSLESASKRIRAAERKRDGLKGLFSSMLHLLMTGQVRVRELIGVKDNLQGVSETKITKGVAGWNS